MLNEVIYRSLKVYTFEIDATACIVPDGLISIGSLVNPDQKRVIKIHDLNNLHGNYNRIKAVHLAPLNFTNTALFERHLFFEDRDGIRVFGYIRGTFVPIEKLCGISEGRAFNIKLPCDDTIIQDHDGHVIADRESENVETLTMLKEYEITASVHLTLDQLHSRFATSGRVEDVLYDMYRREPLMPRVFE